MYQSESIYIAGPECFYTGGVKILNAMRRRAESFGFTVTLPNDNPLRLDNKDLRKNGDDIFKNCAHSINKSTAIIVDLETFRGAEPDGGSIYEVGMAYAQKARCYAYTRDKRAMVHKYQGARLQNGLVYDLDGRVLPYQNLPFSPAVVGSCKIIEGDFDDCLQLLMTDIDEERKHGAQSATIELLPPRKSALSDKPVVYLASPVRYDTGAAERYAQMKNLCVDKGFYAIDPMEGMALLKAQANPYAGAGAAFQNWQQCVRDCDILLADLNDFHGWEPNSDVSFEAGMAWQLGKTCYGYMADTAIMRKRIPHYGEERENRDIYGNDVENFGYPVNLMFASSMPVFEGDFEAVLEKVVKEATAQ